ncbi:MAG: exodeoxyribonuclease VII small subunit [Bacteroidota bacterium]|nr:exodeoxyribonuclease VII small subunit [Candidatus Kapabacteria bacterium]MCS7303023.1 exodeoxyribonuclease VII small subunit [Candidatus Kapabacteria bacterium]MCX7937544.1 exodeoxyribonuclease VII small subunit [Chlorobiota bacterium]MDW8074711.1 exodeoxyribonuclease VII small subunit [Bacteroidota bacterium]MDW8270813.1 exodeoxyribonuclease VII small subunit [Bacteroidota bacterium]
MAKKQPTIEQQLQRLEEIRQHLETADRPIEELLKLYEEGITLAATLRKQLQDIRQRIIVLNQQATTSSQDSS